LSATPILTAGARVGDCVVLTKGAALEGTSILCADRAQDLVASGVFESIAQAKEASEQHASQLSVVADARVALQSLPEGAISS
jgi:hydrogenase maturation factor